MFDGKLRAIINFSICGRFATCNHPRCDLPPSRQNSLCHPPSRNPLLKEDQNICQICPSVVSVNLRSDVRGLFLLRLPSTLSILNPAVETLEGENRFAHRIGRLNNRRVLSAFALPYPHRIEHSYIEEVRVISSAINDVRPRSNRRTASTSQRRFGFV